MFLDRLGRHAARRRGWVVAIWVVAAAGLALGAHAAHGHPHDVFTIPGAESQHALSILQRDFPRAAGDTANVVFHTDRGTLRDPADQAAIAQVMADLARLPHATSVAGPTGPLAAGFTSRDGTIALARVQYDEPATKLGPRAFAALQRAAAPARAASIQVAYNGTVPDYATTSAGGNEDKIGLIVAVVILLFAFGSVVAMGLPIGTALFGLAFGLALISLLSAVTAVGTIAPTLATMIGLGVGIDYSLFIVTRYRENLANEMTVEDAVAHAIGTAGQAVLFAGTTVVIAICGLALSGIPYVAMLGFTASIMVAVMMAAALTLLPALIAFAGRGIDRFRVPGLHLGRHREVRQADDGPRGWARFARTVARHPWPWAVASILVLLTLAAPFTSLRLGQTDDGTAPSGSTQRIAYDLLARGFGPGVNGPLVLVITNAGAGDVVSRVLQAVQHTPDVADVSPPQLDPTRTAALAFVVPASKPDAEATTTLVQSLRERVLPAAVGTSGARALIGGGTAAFIDLGAKITDRLPWFIGGVVLLSFVLLMLVFHSLLVPLTAAVMNLLSVGAAYGVTVAVFQWGWGKEIVGLHQTVPIVSFIPMMLFAVLFGLSMDYQVFLLTRVREEFDRTRDNRDAVVRGVGATARVITSAALIMISVFLSFVANPTPEVKMFGLGLAVAVFVDATVVRMALVPATMELLGRANWWFPPVLDRIVPRLRIE